MSSGLEASPSGQSPADEDACEGQYMLAPLLKQKFKFPKWSHGQHWMGTLDLFVVCRNTFYAFDRLYSPVNQAADFAWQTRRYTSARKSPLERFPPEVLRDILSALEITDQIAVALCSQYLWVHTVWVIREHLCLNHKQLSWAGTPILWLSRWPVYLPQALLEAVPEANCPSFDRKANRIWMHDWARDTIISSETAPSPEYHILIGEFRNQIPSSGIPEQLHPHMESCLDVRAYNNGARCYLRNHALKEYIGLEIVKNGTGTTATFVGHRWLTLDILLLWLITMSRVRATGVSDWGKEPKMEGWAWDYREDEENYPPTNTTRLRHMLISFMVLGKWACHCLEVTDEVSEEMIVHWRDRTLDVETRARSWLMGIYTTALEVRRFPEMRDHWEYWHQVVKEVKERDACYGVFDGVRRCTGVRHWIMGVGDRKIRSSGSVNPSRAGLQP